MVYSHGVRLGVGVIARRVEPIGGFSGLGVFAAVDYCFAVGALHKVITMVDNGLCCICPQRIQNLGQPEGDMIHKHFVITTWNSKEQTSLTLASSKDVPIAFKTACTWSAAGRSESQTIPMDTTSGRLSNARHIPILAPQAFYKENMLQHVILRLHRTLDILKYGVQYDRRMFDGNQTEKVKIISISQNMWFNKMMNGIVKHNQKFESSFECFQSNQMAALLSSFFNMNSKLTSTSEYQLLLWSTQRSNLEKLHQNSSINVIIAKANMEKMTINKMKHLEKICEKRHHRLSLNVFAQKLKYVDQQIDTNDRLANQKVWKIFWLINSEIFTNRNEAKGALKSASCNHIFIPSNNTRNSNYYFTNTDTDTMLLCNHQSSLHSIRKYTICCPEAKKYMPERYMRCSNLHAENLFAYCSFVPNNSWDYYTAHSNEISVSVKIFYISQSTILCSTQRIEGFEVTKFHCTIAPQHKIIVHR
ncbi:hypothetical protein Bhyg_11392 [Pseudolycoriella hygida]|uniref:Uncharacterized protein n=1 Tax=Pseudolycoriella hygida TaxID=35572 RepID=A0A9Q0RYB1_9DIPT|nr:hypothetical protein Bhyg_11392 [Pseudolycoriella hygida]